MGHQLAQLGRNLRAGARIAFLLPVRKLQFRFGLSELLVLFVLSAVLDFGNDWLRYGPNAYVSLYGAGSELFSAALLLLFAALLALACRQRDVAASLPVIVLAALPFVQVVHMLEDAANRWWPAGARALGSLEMVFTAWIVIVLIRC